MPKHFIVGRHRFEAKSHMITAIRRLDAHGRGSVNYPEFFTHIEEQINKGKNTENIRRALLELLEKADRKYSDGSLIGPSAYIQEGDLIYGIKKLLKKIA